MKGVQKDLVGASTTVLILAVLREGPSYGYEIVRRVNEQAEGTFTWQEGTIYPLLHKLERQKLIRCRWQDAPNGRRRKYYQLTSAGRAALGEGARQWGLFHDLVVRLAGAKHA